MFVIHSYAILMAMRLLLLLIIFAIGFSGYSAAAYAADNMTCNGEGRAGCQDFLQDSGDTDQGDQTGKDQNSICQHCCSSHAAAYFATESVIFQLQAVILRPLPVLAYSGDYHFSLLRPPKSLV